MVCKLHVHPPPPAVAIVHTKVKPIVFSGECYTRNWDMKIGAIDPIKESFKPICHTID